MRILLSEHHSVTLCRTTSESETESIVVEDEVFSAISLENRKPIWKDVFPYEISAGKNDDSYELRADYYVGLEWLAEGKKYVHVEPKVNAKLLELFRAGLDKKPEGYQDSAAEEEAETKKEFESASSGDEPVQVNYLRMLLDLYTSDITIEQVGQLVKIDWDASPIRIEQKDDQLTPFLVVKFLKILQSIVKKGLKKSYYRVQENLNNRVKGKILVGQHIKQNVFKNRLTSRWCEYQMFGEDTTENKFLKKVFMFCVSYIQNSTFLQAEIKTQLSHTINYCRPAFEHIKDDLQESSLRQIKTNPFFKEYKEAIHLGNYILRRFAYNISSTTSEAVDTPAFWIDMPRLFELYVYQKLLEANPGLSSKIKYQFGTYGNYLDLLICDKENPIIIDAKYKLQYLTRHIHQDIRQVAGYARLRKVRQEVGLDDSDDRNIACLIIYPTLSKGLGDLSLNALNEIINEKDGESAFAIKAYHKVYKIGVQLPKT